MPFAWTSAELTAAAGIYIPLWFSIAAFGFTGSLHCAAMCGPLAAASCGHKKQKNQAWLYHGSRIASYGIVGLLSGLLGELFFRDLAGIPTQDLALVFGGLMGIYALSECIRALRTAIHQQKFRPGSVILKESKFWTRSHFSAPARLIANIQSVFRRLKLPTSVSLGVVTALLPCGFLYAAIAQAVLLANPLASGIAMILFAVATTPALFVGTLGATYVRKISPRYGSMLAPTILLVASLSILYRGLVAPTCHDTDSETHQVSEP